MEKDMSYNLFLDDVREPYQVGDYMYPVELRSLYRLKEWIVVRSFEQFTKYITSSGLPEIVTFDHDLAPSHYAPEEYWKDYETSKESQEEQIHSEKTGYECAKWLVDYCIENNKKLPIYYCHSLNPVGKDKILDILSRFKQKK